MCIVGLAIRRNKAFKIIKKIVKVIKIIKVIFLHDSKFANPNFILGP